MKSIMKLTPHVVEKIWGGDFLSKLKNIKSSVPIGEIWEISTCPEGKSSFEGKPLTDFIAPLKYLIKYIDTSDYLSVQVHPNDAYAKLHENSSGKTECWFILEAKEGAGIYLGFKKGMTRDKFTKAITLKEDLSQYLNFYQVKRGDFFFVPAGMIHCIGKGVLLAEVQQSSGITYRIWDWDRLENGIPRKLDIEKALDVLNFEEQSIKYDQNVFSQTRLEFVRHTDFITDIIKLDSNEKYIYKIDSQKSSSLIILEGEVVLTIDQETTILKAYDSTYINCDHGAFIAMNAKTKTVMLVVYS